MDRHCTFCHITVAPQDPHQQKVGNKVMHGNCLKNHLRVINDLEQALEVEETALRSFDRKGVNIHLN